MHLLYVDESGASTDAERDKNYYVLGGACVYEKRPYFLSHELDELCASLVGGGAAVELHASPIFNANGEPWASMKRVDRMVLMKRVYDFISQQNLVLFGIAMRRDSFPGSDPVRRTCEELAGRFDAYLERRTLAHNEKQLGLLVFDQSHHAKTLHALLQEFRTAGARFGRIKHLAEAPMFADSRLTRVLQIADFVSYALFRRYERGDSSFLDMIIHKFDQADGKLHGLVHLIADYQNCYCPACITRRT